MNAKTLTSLLLILPILAACGGKKPLISDEQKRNLKTISCFSDMVDESLNTPVELPKKLTQDILLSNWTITREGEFSEENLESMKQKTDTPGITAISFQYLRRDNPAAKENEKPYEKMDVSIIETESEEAAIRACQSLDAQILGRHTLLRRGTTIFELVATDSQMEYQALELLKFPIPVIKEMKALNQMVLDEIERLRKLSGEEAPTAPMYYIDEDGNVTAPPSQPKSNDNET